MIYRRHNLGLDYDPTLAPVGVDLPDLSYIPGLDTPTAGVSTDSSGMSVVTVTGSQSSGFPWGWVLLGVLAWGLTRGQ